jgi:hypothetical protein
MVLLKGYDARGFSFYTNYNSRKGQELAGNGRAALCFFWEPLQRSVSGVGGGCTARVCCMCRSQAAGRWLAVAAVACQLPCAYMQHTCSLLVMHACLLVQLSCWLKHPVRVVVHG